MDNLNYVRNDFIDFLKLNNVGSTIIVTLLGTKIVELTEIIFKNILKPLLHFDYDGDGKSDLHDIKHIEITLFNTKLNVGSFLVKIIELAIVLIGIYIVSKLF